MAQKPTRERVLDFDLQSMRERACVGVRRAAAFLGLSERFLERDLPTSLTLGSSVKTQFLPDPFPEQHVDELRQAWRAWITGNSLRELDQFLSLYFDEAFDKIQQAKMVSGEQPPHYEWQRLDRFTNVADKHRRVLEAAGKFTGQHLDDQSCLVSLSHGRNCLSHDLGIVTPKRATAGRLTVKWLALRSIVEQGDQTYVLEESVMPLQLDPDGPAGRVIIRVEIAERAFAVGDHMRFTPDDLLSICLFYQIVIDRVAEAVKEHAVQAGVVFPNADPPVAGN